jgi:hypothetical protein
MSMASMGITTEIRERERIPYAKVAKEDREKGSQKDIQNLDWLFLFPGSLS